MAQHEVFLVSEVGRIPSINEFLETIRKWFGGKAHIRGEMNNHDIVDLHIDATGFEVDVEQAVEFEAPSMMVDDKDFTVLTAAKLERLRIVAQPVTVLGCPISVNIVLKNLDINWVKLNEDKIGFTVSETNAEIPEMSLDISAPKTPFEKLLIQATHIALFRTEPKLKLLRPYVAFNNYRSNGAQAFGKATIKYGLLRLRVGTLIRFRIRRNFVLSIDKVSLKGSNLLLRLWQQKLLKDVPKTINLADHLPAGLRLKRFDIGASDRLRVQIETVPE